MMGWVAAASALIGLFVSLSGGFHWFVGKHTQKAELEAKMAVAQEQTQHGEYEASVKSYGEILKGSPMYAPAQDGQLSAAMLWVENFQVLGRDDKDPTDLAAAKLDEVMPVLDCRAGSIKGGEGCGCAGASGMGALAELACCAKGVWACGKGRICARHWSCTRRMCTRMRCWGIGSAESWELRRGGETPECSGRYRQGASAE